VALQPAQRLVQYRPVRVVCVCVVCVFVCCVVCVLVCGVCVCMCGVCVLCCVCVCTAVVALQPAQRLVQYRPVRVVCVCCVCGGGCVVCVYEGFSCMRGSYSTGRCADRSSL